MRAVVLTTTLPAEAFAEFDNVIAIVRDFSELDVDAVCRRHLTSSYLNEEDHDYGSSRTSRRPDENKIIAERRAKLAACANKASPSRTTSARAQGGRSARAIRRKTREELEANPVTVVLAGRMMLKREAGKKAAFATLQDSSGPKADGRIQIYATLDLTGEAAMAALHHYDLGDILGVVGTLFKTKTDELTIKVTNCA
jgi:lysyl-tRNA synthetase class II